MNEDALLTDTRREYFGNDQIPMTNDQRDLSVPELARGALWLRPFGHWQLVIGHYVRILHESFVNNPG
jgi:hypothetical protein